MKPIDQTKTLDAGERGNCLAACLASIFELEISQVPALEELPPGQWKIGLDQWASSLGKKIVKKAPDDFVTGEHYIAVGLSDKGNRHATVWLNGSIVHDPHEARKGLVSLEYIFTAEPLSVELA